ncbi:phytanoyl-CoA dioxygenase family protein [Paractinoplanes lichenicola]|uniref:Phytanoyl-CoA dioxygenase family protein n=1 Tax=Paractinoplanes lichenicola TaxID=2802976 RepID=A0ABS1VI92_9ACTN|nr:phytanoyl-CoA dioxygenase family protein [Actinoplanes lichenicola]MBL7254010.1 phytanoyl-CoA dioxygenase family protein [Actinoplanes lichenicola]
MDVDAFVRDGFVKLEQAVPADVVDACVRLLWERIDPEPDDPRTWTEPVHWVGNMGQPPFEQAMNMPVLVDAMNTVIGPGRWHPRNEMGAFPLRFPHADEPDDAGWHIEGAYMPPGETSYWTNVHSSYRALLLLFLFTDVDEHTAPTRIRAGSHMDVPRVLLPYGETGASGEVLSPLVAAASAHRPTVLGTGRAGDVFVCHPFLVHAAQPNHGTRPRFLSQPCISPTDNHMLKPYEGSDSPIARTIRQALNGA